jgi:alcohol dehydrogenase (cytochrome c)
MITIYGLTARLLVLSSLVLAATSARSEGVYDSAQVAAGKSAYDRYCVECHHGSLRGTGHGPALSGSEFVGKWANLPAGELVGFIRSSMATTVPASAGERVFADMAAYILSINQFSAGSRPLTIDERAVPGAPQGGAAAPVTATAGGGAEEGGARRAWEGAGGVAEAAARAGRWINQSTPPLSPVTDEMLRNPPESAWLNWRRTQDGQGFSPLKEINGGNVRSLRLAWSITMRDGSNQVTPLVHDGIMFLTHPANLIQAIDAATGSLIWEYAYPHPPESRTLGGPTRNIAIYKDRLFVATYDAALIALDARTGKLLWRTTKADYTKGYTHSAGPIIADGVVVSGINGCERFKKEGCFITGHDPDTGQELWRTSTIALPGDPNDSSWGGVPVELRGGGDNWIAGSYDPKLNLVFLGTSQPKPWVAASRGMTVRSAALYTNSTLAIEPKTGKLRWFFQHMPGETLDMETGFERVLVDLDGKPYVVTVGKDGILWKLDRRTGKFVDFTELLPQDIFVKPLDKKTGKLVYRDDIVNAKIGDTVAACPSIYGGHNWQASAFNPTSSTLVVPLHQICMEFTGRKVDFVEGGGGYGGESSIVPMPGANGMLGRLSAIDLRDLSTKWSHTQRAMFLTGVLTTAGGLTFVGDLDRYFKAFDSNTGEVLWQSRLGAPLHGYPISYSVGGKQYIAVSTGMGVFKLMTAREAPDIYQPSGGNALYVFELPTDGKP